MNIQHSNQFCSDFAELESVHMFFLNILPLNEFPKKMQIISWERHQKFHSLYSENAPKRAACLSTMFFKRKASPRLCAEDDSEVNVSSNV